MTDFILFLRENAALLFESCVATVYMVFVSALISFCLGLPIALGLTVTAKGQFLSNRFVHKSLGFIVTLGRSIPFIILMIAIIPLTRFLIGTSIGTTAAIVPLSIAAVPFFARILEGKFAALNPGLIEMAQSLGLSPWQIITKVILPESFPAIVNATTVLIVSLTEYSAMAGAVGGSGLGNMAIQYGYYQFNTPVMFLAIFALIFFVLFFQFIGDAITRKVSFPVS